MDALQLLVDRLVGLRAVQCICLETVRQRLKKSIKPWLKQMGCIPKVAGADFVCAMEDVLDVYKRPHDEKRLGAERTED